MRPMAAGLALLGRAGAFAPAKRRSPEALCFDGILLLFLRAGAGIVRPIQGRTMPESARGLESIAFRAPCRLAGPTSGLAGGRASRPPKKYKTKNILAARTNNKGGAADFGFAEIVRSIQKGKQSFPFCMLRAGPAYGRARRRPLYYLSGRNSQ